MAVHARQDQHACKQPTMQTITSVLAQRGVIPLLSITDQGRAAVKDNHYEGLSTQSQHHPPTATTASMRPTTVGAAMAAASSDLLRLLVRLGSSAPGRKTIIGSVRAWS